MLVRRISLALTLAAAMASTLASPASSVAAPPTCFGEPATIVGEGVLRGTPGPDVIVATSSATEVHAGPGNDRICGSPLAYGGDGNDRILLGRSVSGDIELMGQRGADLIVVTAPLFAFLYGGAGPDVLKARGGEQWLLGGPGSDRMSGGAGPDQLLGGGGQDRAYGGDGVDRCDAERVRGCEED